MKSSFLFNCFAFCIFCAFLHSANCFWFWNLRLPYLNLGALLFIGVYQLHNRSQFKFSFQNVMLSLFLFVIQMYLISDDIDMMKVVGRIFYSIVVVVVMSMDKSLQKKLFTYIYTYLAIVLFFSLVAFFLLMLHVPLPDMGRVVHPTASFYWYDNYIILIHGCYDIRFNGIFCEPGHLGMILSFLLFINGYDYKNKSTLILTFALLCTLSLAGYVLYGVGALLRIFIYDARTAIKYIVKIVMAFLFLFVLVKGYNNGDNLVNELILLRLEYDESTGEIVGNNRSSISLKKYYESLSTEEFLLGIGAEKYKNESRQGDSLVGAGYQLFIVIYGIVGIFLVFVFYCLIVRVQDKVNRREYLSLLVLFSLAFWQRSYPMWTSWIYTFIIANGVFIDSVKRKLNRK